MKYLKQLAEVICEDTSGKVHAFLEDSECLKDRGRDLSPGDYLDTPRGRLAVITVKRRNVFAAEPRFIDIPAAPDLPEDPQDAVEEVVEWLFRMS